MEKPKTCIYYMQGRCKYGEKCFYSHAGFLESLVIRHTESEFNKMVNSETISEVKKRQFHSNQQYIDCHLTEEGVHHAQNIKIPHGYLSQQKQVDIVFVSPLNRALETAQLIIKSQKLNVKKVIIIPELTEVLSKICDFSHNLDDKIKKYRNFDFREMNRYLKETEYLTNVQHWQDTLVDSKHHHHILAEQSFGLRYLKILQIIFPIPLQNSDRCFQRALRALDVMKEISEKRKAHKIIIVSHNRILRYIDGRFSKGRATSFSNGEIRKIIF